MTGRLVKLSAHLTRLYNWTVVQPAVFGVLEIISVCVSVLVALNVKLNTETISSGVLAILTAAPAVGALAISAFFITAQLNAAGRRRAALRQLYRLRHVLPTSGSIAVIFVLGIFLYGAAGSETGRAGELYVGLYAFLICQVLALGVAAVFIFIRISLLFDEQSAVRFLVRDIEASDAEEWGLFDIREMQGNLGSKLRISIDAHRFNAGLRDPLMPIHEFLMEAEDRDFTGFIGSMLGRVDVEYDASLKIQAPDPENWRSELFNWTNKADVRLARVWARYKRLKSRSIYEFVRQQRDGRLKLLLLVVHYVRRIPANRRAGIERDFRRQYVEHMLCRLLFDLCRRSSLLKSEAGPLRFAPAPTYVSEFETKVACSVLLFSIMDLEYEFSLLPSLGHKQPGWALLILADSFESFGWFEHAKFARYVFAWSRDRTDHVDRLPPWASGDTNQKYPGGRKRYPPRPRFESSFVEDPWISWRKQVGREAPIKE